MATLLFVDVSSSEEEEEEGEENLDILHVKGKGKVQEYEKYVKTQQRIIPFLFHIFSIFYVHYVIFTIMISILIIALWFLGHFSTFWPVIGIIVDFGIEWILFGSVWSLYMFPTLPKVRRWNFKNYKQAKRARTAFIRILFLYTIVRRGLGFVYYAVFHFAINKEASWTLVYHYGFYGNLLLTAALLASGFFVSIF